MGNLDLSLYRSIEALADNDIPNPILRIDFFLHAVITGEECNIEPVTKTEEYLYALATGDESRLGLYGDSISLLEEYLEALRTGDIDNLREPRTREEIILYQAITGEDLGVEPVSRIETYLSMLQNAGGLDYILSTSTNASVIPLTNSINGKARVQEMCGDTVRIHLNDNGYKLQSCGQDDENGHKIEILSNNRNLWEKEIVVCRPYNSAFEKGENYIKIKTLYQSSWVGVDLDFNLEPNEKYVFKTDFTSSSIKDNILAGIKGSNDTWIEDYYKTTKGLVFTVPSDGFIKIKLFLSNETVSNIGDWCEFKNIYLEKNDTISDKYTPSKYNKKEILLNEPLRGLPNGVRDRIVYLDENTTPIAPEGKGLYLEKNVDEFIPNTIDDVFQDGLSDNVCLFRVRHNCRIDCLSAISNVFKYVQGFSLQTVPFNYYVTGDGHMWVAWTRTSNTENDKRDFIDYVNSNNVKVCCALQTPIYTKIPDVNLECYENATVYVDSGVVAPTKTVIRYPYKQPALFSL